MSIKRLLDRVSTASRLGTAALRNHELKFHKISNVDGSAKCDAEETGNSQDIVIGVVYDISVSDKSKLDRKEGLGYGYEEKNVCIELQDGTRVKVFTYYATNIDPDLKPLHWYKEHVLRGAREHGLPKEYINKIVSIESVEDPDADRRKRELGLYHL